MSDTVSETPRKFPQNLGLPTRCVALNQATLLAGFELLKHQQTAQVTELGGKGDFVTTGDHLSTEIMTSYLGYALDGPAQFYFEESKDKIPNPEKGLVVVGDGIDGTTNYFNGDSWWSVSLGLVLNGVPEAAAIFMPALRRLFYAHQGLNTASAWDVDTGDISCPKVSCTEKLAGARVFLDWKKGDATITPKMVKAFYEYGVMTQLRMCCTAAMMAVAQGQVDVFIHPGPQPYDIAAAGLIVEKAGGRVTTMRTGECWGPFCGSVVATNGRLHDEVLELLADRIV